MEIGHTIRDCIIMGVLCCVFVVVPITCLPEDVSLEQGPRNVSSIIEGDTVVLPCILKDLSLLTFVYWYRHETEEFISFNSVVRVDDERKNRYNILGNTLTDSNLSLQITDARVTDSGTYTCGVYTDHTLTRRIDLANGTLRVLPDYNHRNSSSVPLCTKSTRTRASVGDRVRLTCLQPIGNDGIGPRLELAWYKNFEDGVSNPLKEPENGNQSVVERVLRPDDNGVNFSCKVQYPELGVLGLMVGGECSVMPLRVPPTASIEPSGVLKIARNSDLVIRCKGFGIPRVVGYDWKLRPQIPAQRYEIQENGSVLRIKKAQREDDSTIVTCVVRTESGLTGEATTVLKLVGSKSAADTSSVVNINLVIAGTSSVAAGIVFLLIVVICIIIRRRRRNRNLRNPAEIDKQENLETMIERPGPTNAGFATNGPSPLPPHIVHYDYPSQSSPRLSGNDDKDLDSTVPHQHDYMDLSSKTQLHRDVNQGNEYSDYVGPGPANCEDDDSDYEAFEIPA